MGACPARDGYWAAAMVAAGFSANPDVLAGRENFQDTFSDAADRRASSSTRWASATR